MSRNDDTLNDIKRQVDRIREQQIADNHKKRWDDLAERFPYPSRQPHYRSEYHPPTNRKEALYEIISITIFLCASLAGAYYGILGWFLKLFSVILFFYLFKAIINYQDLPEHPQLSRRQAINWSVITDGLKAILLLSILVVITYRVEIAVGSWQANLYHHPYYGQPSFYLLFVLLIVYVLVLVIVDSFWE